MPLTKGTGDRMGQKKMWVPQQRERRRVRGEEMGRGQGEIKIV